MQRYSDHDYQQNCDSDVPTPHQDDLNALQSFESDESVSLESRSSRQKDNIMIMLHTSGPQRRDTEDVKIGGLREYGD